MIREPLHALLRETGAERRYRALEPRERLLLHIAGAFVLAGILYAAVFSPAYGFRESALARFDEQQYRVEWMRSHEAEARRRSEGGEVEPNRSLLTLIDATARKANVRLARYLPESDGSVNVVIQQQPFNDVLRWTVSLADEKLRVVQVAIDASDSEGIVNARMSIR